jgi:hypothetical protein
MAEVCMDDELLKESEAVAKLHWGSAEARAPDAGVVTAQVSATVPVKEVPGVTEMFTLPLLPGSTSTLPLLESVKLLELLEFDCQKSPQPAKSAAAAINPAQLPILITAPCAAPVAPPLLFLLKIWVPHPFAALWRMGGNPCSRHAETRLQAIASERHLSCPPAAHPAD